MVSINEESVYPFRIGEHKEATKDFRDASNPYPYSKSLQVAKLLGKGGEFLTSCHCGNVKIGDQHYIMLYMQNNPAVINQLDKVFVEGARKSYPAKVCYVLKEYELPIIKMAMKN